jgi:5-methyltetrahydropteroyltriglutamate--homocysteine methyltransferase
MAGLDRILVTHVGSLVRPPQLVEFLKLIEAGQPYEKGAYEACLKASIDEVVRQQVEAGVDIVSDGEFSKGRNWAFYIHDRITGIATREATPEEMKDPMSSAGGGQDMKAFPEFYAEYNRTTGLGARLGKRFVVDGPLVYHDATVKRDIATLKAAAAKAGANGAFLPVVAPASALPGAKNEHYSDEKALLFALADCLHQEYQAIVDLGAVARGHKLKQSGVRYLAALFMQTRIPKGAKTSNWATLRLSSQQIAYAATDAWICRELYLKFEELQLL